MHYHEDWQLINLNKINCGLGNDYDDDDGLRKKHNIFIIKQ